MKAVIQRVVRSSVSVLDDGAEREIGRIGAGLMVLIGVAAGDTDADARRLADKIAGLRIFPDAAGKLNHDVRESGGAILAISQFTLLADTRKGRRPSFVAAARPEIGAPLYDAVVARLRAAGLTVHTGLFGAHMHVDILNDGPVTIVIDTADSGPG